MSAGVQRVIRLGDTAQKRAMTKRDLSQTINMLANRSVITGMTAWQRPRTGGMIAGRASA